MEQINKQIQNLVNDSLCELNKEKSSYYIWNNKKITVTILSTEMEQGKDEKDFMYSSDGIIEFIEQFGKGAL